jgi:hypothetical protein
MNNLSAIITDQFDAAWNANDEDAVLRCFAADAVVHTEPALPGAPATFRGRNEIRQFVRTLIPNFHVRSRNVQEQGDRVTWFATVTSDTIRQLGVDALDTDCEAIMQDGKTVAFTVTFTPETLAELQAAAQVAGAV